MSNKTFFKFSHKCDVYEKTITTNAAGQKLPTYTMAKTIDIQFQAPTSQSSASSDRRVNPYQDNISRYEAIVPSEYSPYISYDNRISNIVDRYLNVLDNDTFEIIGIQPKFTLSGKKHHITVSLRRVVEG